MWLPAAGPGTAASCPRAAGTVVALRPLEGQGSCASQAALRSGCPVSGLQSVSLRGSRAQGSLGLPSQPLPREPWPLRRSLCRRPPPRIPASRPNSSVLIPPAPFLSPEAINCLMRAIEIYTDMVRATACPVPTPGHHCPSLPSPPPPPAPRTGGEWEPELWSPALGRAGWVLTQLPTAWSLAAAPGRSLRPLPRTCPRPSPPAS